MKKMTFFNSISFKSLPPISSTRLTLIVSAYITLILNLRIGITYAAANEIEGFWGLLQAFAFLMFVFCIVFILLSLFNFKRLQKASLILALLTSVPAFYFAMQFNTLFDESMLNNALETDTKEAADLLSGAYWTMLLLLGVIPSLIIFKYPVKYPSLYRSLLNNFIAILVAVLVLIGSIAPYYAKFSSFVRNNNTVLKNSLLPYAPLHALYKTLQLRYFHSGEVVKNIDQTAKRKPNNEQTNAKPIALVVIVGETARESSFTPILQRFSGQEGYLNTDDQLIYFTNLWSCGTNTAASLPCMFSTFGKDDYQRSYNREYENIAELINRVGYQVTWRNNNSGCKGLCNELNKDPITLENSPQFSAYGLFYDEALVVDLEQRISASVKDQVIFLHQLGSHGPAYFKRLPNEYKLEQPACESQDFGKCSQQEIVNAYNNTIIYTNRVIAGAISRLKQLEETHDTALVYLSDHGESTGEGGYYLHGIPYFMAPEEQTHIPMLFWLSDGFAKQKQIDLACLHAKSDDKLSHDNFSHSMIGLLDIETSYYQENWDIFASCRQ